MLAFVPSAWVDRPDSRELVAVGRDRHGARVTATIGPCGVHFYVRVPPPVQHALGADVAARVWWSAVNRLKTRTAAFEPSDITCTLRRARSLYGHQEHDDLFVAVAAPTLATLREIARALGTWGAVDRRLLSVPTELFETDVPALTRFLHALDTAPHHPIALRVETETADAALGRVVTARAADATRVAEDERWPCELRVAAFDIEVMSDDRVSFPDAARAADFIAQIGVVERWRGADTRTLFVCQPTGPLTDAAGPVDVRRSDDEPAMLADFVAWVYARDIDCLAGYNTFGFDWAYIVARLERAGRAVDALVQCAPWRAPRVTTQKLTSAAFGCNEYTYVAVPGAVALDLLVFLRRELKLESFKLDDVAFELTGRRKLDMPPRQIFASLASDGRSVADASAARADVGRYCLVDCVLVLDIIDSRDVTLNLLETANVTGVQFGDILVRGMQVRSYTQILRVGNAMGYLLPRAPRGEAERYEGATVLHAEPGLFYEGVGVLDFLSLYPSIMIAWNVCYSTLLRDDQDPPHHTIHDESGNPVARFASASVGVLPTLLRQLWDGRKQTKRQMALEQDPLRRKLLNAKQLAQKVGMNSIYGMTGSGTGMLPCLAIASAITTQGRTMLAASRDFVEANFPCRVVYGDSVAADTPIDAYTAAGRVVMPVSELYTLVAAIPTDEPTSVRVATHLGLRDVLSVVQHATTKPLFRVTVESGAFVDVTEDHSLVAADGTLLRPTDVVVGTTRLMLA
jgi:DNA polymerase elongation subunit (family B)